MHGGVGFLDDDPCSGVAVAAGGGQTALMAPTELLAEQHFRTLSNLVESAGGGIPLRVGLLTASLPRAEIKQVRGLLSMGEIDLVVGTHALVQGEDTVPRALVSIVGKVLAASGAALFPEELDPFSPQPFSSFPSIEFYERELARQLEGAGEE